MDISQGMNRLLRIGVPVIAAALSVAAWAQLPKPGQDQPAPPPQPGQLAPAPDPAKTAPNPAPAGSPETTIEAPESSSSDTPIRVGVRYVLVPTTVLDPDGHGYVNGLQVGDFELLDNDKAQKITSEFTQQPVSVVLVVQANAEVEPMLPTVKKSGVLLQGLVTGQDGDAAVVAFDHRKQVIQDFTNDPAQLDDAMQKITAGSTTAALIDAVMYADGMLKRHDRQNVRRRVIVLLSRNVDKGSETHLEEAIHAMQFDNVIVYCVDMSKLKTTLMEKPAYPGRQNGGVPPEALPNARGQIATGTDVVQQMDGNWLKTIPPTFRSIRDLFKKTPAEAFTFFTGGNLYSFSNQKGLEQAITDIGKDLNSQYLLSYSPNDKSEPGFHHIRVVVNRPGLQVRTRPGYWWGGGLGQ